MLEVGAQCKAEQYLKGALLCRCEHHGCCGVDYAGSHKRRHNRTRLKEVRVVADLEHVTHRSGNMSSPAMLQLQALDAHPSPLHPHLSELHQDIDDAQKVTTS